MTEPVKRVSSLAKIAMTLNLIVLFILLFAAVKFRYKIYNKLFPRKHVTIVMLGDSHTANGEWDELLSRSDVANEGRGGFTTSHFIMMLQQSVITRNPKICFIEGGGNDISVGIPMTRTLSNINGIVDTLKTHHIIPVLTLVLYTNKDTIANKKTDSLNTFIKEIAFRKHVLCIDPNDKLSETHFLKKRYSKEDGIHLQKNAYPFWADEVKKAAAKYNL